MRDCEICGRDHGKCDFIACRDNLAEDVVFLRGKLREYGWPTVTVHVEPQATRETLGALAQAAELVDRHILKPKFAVNGHPRGCECDACVIVVSEQDLESLTRMAGYADTINAAQSTQKGES